jgi:hypothetical protein
VFLRDGFEATGAVRLRGVKIGGGLDCRGATLVTRTGVDPIALVARDATIGGALIIRDRRAPYSRTGYACGQGIIGGTRPREPVLQTADDGERLLCFRDLAAATTDEAVFEISNR